MKPLQEAIKNDANEDKGILKKSIKLRTTTRRGKGDKKNRFIAIQAGVFTAKGSEERRRNSAALAQEYGTSKQAAKPFIRNNTKSQAQKILNTFSKELGTKIKGNT